jgi:hypothetical protein
MRRVIPLIAAQFAFTFATTPRVLYSPHMPNKKTEIQELSEFIRDHMVTKDDLKDGRTQGRAGADQEDAR